MNLKIARLVLNAKCEVVMFTQCSRQIKLLGVNIDENLNFTQHITHLSQPESRSPHALAQPNTMPN